MEQGEASGVLLEILHWAHLSTDSPVYIHLEEDLGGVGVLNHIVVPHLAFHLVEFVGMVVVAKLQTGGIGPFTNLIEVVADDLGFLEVAGVVDTRVHQIFHPCGLMGSNTLIPPCKGTLEIARGQFLIVEVVPHVARKHLQPGSLNIGLELFGRHAIQFSVAIVCSFHSCISHCCQLFQSAFMVLCIFAWVTDKVAHAVHLECNLFLLGIGRETH